MQVRLLGPVEVAAGDVARPLGGSRRSAVLAMLALEAGQAVGITRLVDAVWEEPATPRVVNTLRTHVSYLRTVLGGKRTVLASPRGYVLNLPGEATDVQAVHGLVAAAARATGAVERAARLREALGLWRGQPLAGLTGLAGLREQAERLGALRVQIQRDWCEAGLAAGDHAALVPELALMADRYPLDELICEQLMTALAGSGDPAGALAAYRRLRQRLRDELAIDPTPRLRDLATAVRRHDMPSATRALTPLPVVAGRPVPAQLPAAIPGFAGRGPELAQLDDALRHLGPGGPEADSGVVVISAVSGTAGVGKTALAVHWAHRVAAHFPDGQLYVNLRGFSPGDRPLDPAEAVRGFLDALGVAPEHVPPGVAARAGLYRRLLAGKRVLVVLDNARDGGQVRPLLPGSPGSLAIVTSRHSLTGLATAGGGRVLSLDLLTGAGARDLLARRLGGRRVAAEPEAVAAIIELCARLPLALSLIAARAAISHALPLAAIATELAQAASTLDLLEVSDPACDPRAVFSWSYRTLEPAAARLFRLLGLHPGAGITVAAAASLAAVTPQRAGALLAALTQANLLTEPGPGRYAFHDLLRAYAAEQARAHDSDADRAAALRRILDHYLHTAHAAQVRMDAYLAHVSPGPPAAGAVVDGPASDAAALDWFAAEYAGALAAVRLAAEAGLDSHAWQLASCLMVYQLRRGRWDDLAAVQRLALASARRSEDLTGEAYALLAQAFCHARAGRSSDAEPLFWQGLRLLESAGGHPSAEASVHSQLGWLAERRHDYPQMVAQNQQALELHRRAGNQELALVALSDLGYSYALTGDYGQAMSYCQQALTAFQQRGQLSWQSAAWHSLGFIHHKQGSHELAVTCFQRSIDLCQETADKFNEADTLATLGDVHHDAGDQAAAARAWTQALHIFDEISHPDADRIRARLRSHGPASAGSFG